MGAPGPEQRKEPRYQVTYHTYLASGRRLSYTPSVERVVGLKYAKRSLLVLQNFAIFRLCHAHVRKDTRLSTAFPYCKRRKAGRGLGTRLRNMLSTTLFPGYDNLVKPCHKLVSLYKVVTSCHKTLHKFETNCYKICCFFFAVVVVTRYLHVTCMLHFWQQACNMFPGQYRHATCTLCATCVLYVTCMLHARSILVAHSCGYLLCSSLQL